MKKILLLSITLLLAITITGCGSGNAPKETNSNVAKELSNTLWEYKYDDGWVASIMIEANGNTTFKMTDEKGSTQQLLSGSLKSGEDSNYVASVCDDKYRHSYTGTMDGQSIVYTWCDQEGLMEISFSYFVDFDGVEHLKYYDKTEKIELVYNKIK